MVHGFSWNREPVMRKTSAVIWRGCHDRRECVRGVRGGRRKTPRRCAQRDFGVGASDAGERVRVAAGDADFAVGDCEAFCSSFARDHIWPLRVSSARAYEANHSKSSSLRRPVSPEKTWLTL